MIEFLVILAAVLVIALTVAGKMKGAPRQDAEARETGAKREIVLEATVGGSVNYEAHHEWAMKQAHHLLICGKNTLRYARELCGRRQQRLRTPRNIF